MFSVLLVYLLLYIIVNNFNLFHSVFSLFSGVGLPTGVTMREKKSGALSKVQKLKKRLSHSFGRLCKFLKYFMYRNIFLQFD